MKIKPVHVENSPKRIRVRGKARLRVVQGAKSGTNHVSDARAYWAKRRNHQYFKKAALVVKDRWPSFQSILDVGGGNSRFLDRFEGQKAVADINPKSNLYKVDEVEFYVTDGTLRQFDEDSFDVVVCLQTIEHDMPEPADMVRVAKMGVVVSYPYRWKVGTACHQGKDRQWVERKMGCEAVAHFVVMDNGLGRGLAVFEPFKP